MRQKPSRDTQITRAAGIGLAGLLAVTVAVSAVACAETTASAPAPATATAATPAAAGAAKEIAWADMNKNQRLEYMKSVVAPRMKQVFVNFSPDRFGKMNCMTCHGDSATEGTFKMPNPKLPKLPTSPDGFKALAAERPSGDGVHEERGEAEDGRAARHARIQPRDEVRIRLHGMPHDGAVRCSPRGFPGMSRRTRSQPTCATAACAATFST